MSRNSTTIKVYRGSKRAPQQHVATFASKTDFSALKEPLQMQRQAPYEPKRNQPTHRFGWEPTAMESKNLPLLLEDGLKNVTTGTYDEVPGVYMVFVKEGNSLRAYPVSSWFKFGAPKAPEPDTNTPNIPVVKKEPSGSVQEQIRRKLGFKEEEEQKLSRLRATRESRFSGATEDGDEDGEDQDYDVNFDNDEDIAAREDVVEEEEVVPKKMTKKQRRELARMKAAAGEMMEDEEDEADWVQDLLYGDLDDELDGESGAADGDDADNDDEGADGENADGFDGSGLRGAAANLKKRPRAGDADEGRGDLKRKAAQSDKERRDRHAIISTLRSLYQNTPGGINDSSAIISSLRNSIPTFSVGASRPGIPKEELENRNYWGSLLKGVLIEYASAVPKQQNKFTWKAGK